MSEIQAAAGRYTTIARDHRTELDIKRSRFITVLRRTETEDEARELIAELRREFHDARHHCSAFVLGPGREVQRSSDDGEPSGTAGIPMLEALTKRETFDGAADLSDITAVTVRYFGGILLGAGGLVRAYSESVSSALSTAPLVRRRRMQLYTVPASHAGAGRLENDLRSAGYTVRGTEYGAGGAVITVALPDVPGSTLNFQEHLASLTAGDTSAELLATEWIDL
ncbi:YigZ family protein [Arthrobacter koreensis]|uniref:IMPACT family protein n=1 Tax=Arthrobacter koreensis TaxID=199136 RepID=UPI002DB71A9E|nr:YigZ family protein [Arthrobacter koreensis]MEB7504829.1 IMPACT family protein [Arthrobacter koreensis]